MKKIITGGLSDEEARAILRKRGISALMRFAGMIPQKADKFDDMVWRVIRNEKFNALRANYVEKKFDRFGEYHETYLDNGEDLCFDCAWLLREYFGFQIYFQYVQDYDMICECCGGRCDEGIPF